MHKTASVATALPGDTFTYTIVVEQRRPGGASNGVLVSDPVPSSLIAQSWTCVGAAGGVCDVASGTGSPLVHADLPLGGSVTILLGRAGDGRPPSGPILNVATASASLSGSARHRAGLGQHRGQLRSCRRRPSLSITKTTPATIFSKVGSVVTFTLVATNTGATTLTNVTITDPERDARQLRAGHACSRPVGDVHGQRTS